MNCHICAAEGSDSDATGICMSCGAGLCATHRAEQLPGPGGTAIGCRHRQPNDERGRA